MEVLETRVSYRILSWGGGGGGGGGGETVTRVSMMHVLGGSGGKFLNFTFSEVDSEAILESNLWS